MIRIYQGWRIRHEPLNHKNERFVATFQGHILMAASIITLQRRIEAVMEEVFA